METISGLPTLVFFCSECMMATRKQTPAHRGRTWLRPDIWLPIITLALVVSLHTLLWDRLFGLDVAEKAIASFEKSYGMDASNSVRPADAAWAPLKRLIFGYSTATFPHDKEPKVLARFVALASAVTKVGPNQIAEWTAPTTPLALIYREWPGETVPPEDYVIIGTVADLKNWLEQYRNWIRFIVQDVMLGLLSIALVIFNRT